MPHSDLAQMDINLSTTAIENLFRGAKAEGHALHAMLSMGDGLQAVYDRYLTLALSPIGMNFLDLQITDLERGMALTFELELFLENLAKRSAQQPIVTFDLGETVRRYDCVLNWVSDHVSRAFTESYSSLRNARSTEVGGIFLETYELFFEAMSLALCIGSDLAIDRDYLIDMRSTHVQGMNVAVEQRHVDQEPKCSICLADLILAETVCKTPCNHLFHAQCIITWFEKDKTCPLCRTNCLLITFDQK